MEFDKLQSKATHVRWKHSKNPYTEELRNKARASNLKYDEIKYGKKIKEDIPCYICKKPINVEYREGKQKSKYFCSRACANTRVHSEETKQKISEGVLRNLEINPNANCRDNHNNKFFTSKSERALIEALQKDGFTNCKRIFTPKINFDVDIYHMSKNIWIESDGPYHFSKIHKNHNYAKTVLRDCIENEYAINNKILLIRINNEKYQLEEQLELINMTIDRYIDKIGKEGLLLKFY